MEVMMRRHSLLGLLLAAASLSLFPAFSPAQHPAGGGVPAARPNVTNPNAQADPNQSGVRRVDDNKFLLDTAMGGLTEVALGKLAVEKGSSDAVKQFGQKMIDDHTKVNDELKQIAVAGSVPIPDALDSKHQSRIDKLAKLSGTEFDKAYIKDQMKYYQQNVKEFQEEAQFGYVSELKDLASKSLPTLQQHLEAAKDLNKRKK
jgi:putative membrane protein